MSSIPLLAILLIAADCHAADSAPVLLANKLKSLAGSSSRDCGSVPLHGDRESAIACAKDASSSGNAYRVAIQLQGNDASIWQGAARDDRGKLWVAFYDLDSSGGAENSPTLSVLSCHEILFVTQGGEVLDCKPVSGER